MGGFQVVRNPVYRLRQRLFPHSMATTPYYFAMLSHPGRVRTGNEDRCAASVEAGAFVVCDGMGGAAAGEVASEMAAKTFLKMLMPTIEKTPRTPTPDARLDAAIQAANEAVYEHSRSGEWLHGMGTTLVALLVQRSAVKNKLSVTLAHVGDSRCYLFRKGVLTLLTTDHSLVEEQLRAGEITAEEAEVHPMRNIITRAVGSQASVEPEIRHLDVESGDLYLLASDGLTRELTEKQIAQTIQRAQSKEQLRRRAPRVLLASLCQTLVEEANDAGGGDNISVLLLQVA